MTFLARSLPALALGFCLTTLLPAQEPARLDVKSGPMVASQPPITPNQQLANTIADQLRQGGRLCHYAIDVTVHDGCAELTGHVADQPQREEALRIVQGVPGVERVIDRLTLADSNSITRTQAASDPPTLELSPLPRKGPQPEVAPSESAALPEPTPIFQAPAPSPYDTNTPRMPPYAWPTYAPYNNYSRVATPLAYPYQSWPFIGPIYPFPKVPLGWRSVKLQWEDGNWYFSKVANQHDWWHLRYW